MEHPEEYIYSNAGDYADEGGLLDVTIIDFRWKTIR